MAQHHALLADEGRRRVCHSMDNPPGGHGLCPGQKGPLRDKEARIEAAFRPAGRRSSQDQHSRRGLFGPKPVLPGNS